MSIITLDKLSGRLPAVFAAGALLAGTAQAEPEAVAAPDNLGAAISSGTPHLNLRLRYETVDQDNALEDAEALTLRAALSYDTATWHDLAGFIELETVGAMLDDYSGTPPPVQYSVVADPDDSELNRWGVRYTGLKGLTATLGRDRLVLDNARWVGNVGWRQNEQTYDGAFLKYAGIQDVVLQYAYLSNVNNIFFANIDLDAHLLNAAWTAAPWLAVSGYGYFLDYETVAAATPDADTFGLRASGTVPAGKLAFSYAAEIASQEAETAGGDFDAVYWFVEAGIGYGAFKLSVAQEVLGSDDGNYAVMTPLATLHAFNGWTDVFLVTPTTGIEDFFITLSGGVEKVKFSLVHHDFEANEGGADYGSEWGAVVSRPLLPGLVGGVKFAQYESDGFAVDTDKLWVWLQYGF